MPDLESRLLDLGRAVRVDPPIDLAERVLARLAAEPAPSRLSTVTSWVRARARWLAALIVGLLGLGIVLSPVGAEVREWFGFHGVVVEEGLPEVGGEPYVPAAEGRVSLDEAERLAGFDVTVPAALGQPDRVAVSPDRALVSMTWGSGAETLRMDQFDGELEPRFWKTSLDAELVPVGGFEALWFPTPHEVVLLVDGAMARSYPPRLAAATLIWVRAGVTMRLEGDLSRDRAAEIAESCG
ncbi:hypothetical protein [Nocardioides sp. LHG3406-4]|uniref:hypothetical protein n=1 Tax=Nocardioides sp. LHG3406-4 TaxID=2804575 RepID=UPI003CE6B66A